MLWNPETPVSRLVEDFTAVFGKKSGDAARLLLELIEVQDRELVEGSLISFLTGEDFYDYLGYQIGITTHPPRLPYLTVYQMDADARAELQENRLARLEDLGGEFGEICAGFEGLAGKVPEASRPWLAELRDGACVDYLRTEHSLKLYQAVLEGGEGGLSLLGEARGEREKAAEIISRREASYRYPLERYIGRGENPTIYRFRYLEQAHTLCFWRRQEEEVKYLLENGREAPVNLLPTCID